MNVIQSREHPLPSNVHPQGVPASLNVHQKQISSANTRRQQFNCPSDNAQEEEHQTYYCARKPPDVIITPPEAPPMHDKSLRTKPADIGGCFLDHQQVVKENSKTRVQISSSRLNSVINDVD